MKKVLLLILLVKGINLFAQDTHYWTQQFGSHSTLMSGSLVAGEEDISMLYYNPGAIGNITSGSITISANMYRVENVQVTNVIGNQADFKSNQFATIPLMAGGVIRTKGKLRMAYGIMSPVDFNFQAIGRIDNELPMVDDPESPGDELLIASDAKNAKLIESMVGFGAGYPLNENLSVGATVLFTLRSQNYFETILTRMFLNDSQNTFVNTSFVENVNYWNVRSVLKLGAVYTMDNWSFGLTMSTPSINIMGKGTVAIDVAANNYKLSDGRIDILASDRQTKLETKYKAPLSISGGAKYKSAKSTYALSAQYFGSIAAYDVVQAQPSDFIRPADVFEELGSESFLRVHAAARPVFNVALGYENRISEKLTVNFGVRNDMSYYDSEVNDLEGINTVISSWNLFHFAGGAKITKNNNTISAGLLLSFGNKDDYEQVGNLGGDFSESELLQGSTTITDARYTSYGLMLGYTYTFN